ncbi:MAG: outer membrane protein [Nonlabens sp.]|jgi:outer membrane protein
MIKNILLLTIALLLTPLASFSQEEMNLEKAISIGLKNNFGIKIAEKNIAIADNNNSWARAGKGPTVDLNGSLSNTLINDNNEASFLRGAFFNSSLAGSVDANWVLYSGGRIAIAKNQLELASNQQKVLRSQEAHNLIRDISQGYADVLVQMERRQFFSESFTLSKERLTYENVKKKFGQSNSFNILQFENALTTDSINLINQDNAINISKRNLYLTIESDKEYIFSERLNITREELDKDKIRQRLEEENYTLKTLRVLAVLDRLNTNLQEAGRKPTVSLNGSFGVSGTAFKFFADDPASGDPFETIYSNRVNGNVGLAANWNLYDGGLRKENIQSAKLQEETTQLSILQAKAQLYRQVDILLENYNHQLNLLDLTEVQIQNARRNIELSEERFKAGQITSLDFRQIQNQFLLAANNRVNAIYNLLITKSEIDWLVGTF